MSSIGPVLNLEQFHCTKSRSQRGPAQGAWADARGELESCTTDSLGRGNSKQGCWNRGKSLLGALMWQWHEGRSWVWDEGPQAGALIQKTHKGWWQCWVWSPMKRVQLHPHLARKLTSSYSDWELLFDVIISITTSSVIYHHFDPAVLKNGVHCGCYNHLRNFDTKLPAF